MNDFFSGAFFSEMFAVLLWLELRYVRWSRLARRLESRDFYLMNVERERAKNFGRRGMSCALAISCYLASGIQE